jgi:hypothetical protein
MRETYKQGQEERMCQLELGLQLVSGTDGEALLTVSLVADCTSVLQQQ